jgi:hypothetical protein
MPAGGSARRTAFRAALSAGLAREFDPLATRLVAALAEIELTAALGVALSPAMRSFAIRNAASIRPTFRARSVNISFTLGMRARAAFTRAAAAAAVKDEQ